jgi:methionine synthase I (cobalamin-dependent)
MIYLNLADLTTIKAQMPEFIYDLLVRNIVVPNPRDLEKERIDGVYVETISDQEKVKAALEMLDMKGYAVRTKEVKR